MKINQLPNFAEVRVPITLDRPRTLVFNLNTMAKFEEGSKRFYFDMLLTLWEARQSVIAKIGIENVEKIRRGEPVTDVRYNLFDVVRKIQSSDLRYLIWAACHVYDEEDNPSWPISANQVGRLIRPMELPRFLELCLKGHADNAPTKEEVGEAPTAEIAAAPTVETTPEDGGAPSTESLAADFA